jgi:hypothetical protein
MKGGVIMTQQNKRLSELKTISRHCREAIDDLEDQVDAIKGKKHIATVELLDHMKQQQIVVDQYLDLARKRGDDVWRRNADELQYMLKDIDATYRRALVYLT